MNHTELAFVNQQLASMLRCGIPLEGGLRQLCATMNRGPLRRELQLLESDLAAGVPLAKAAAARRNLPEFYTRLLALGARGNDLPGVLNLLADYYENAALVWTQLKGLMVYPAIVLTLSLAFSVWAAALTRQISGLIRPDIGQVFALSSSVKHPRSVLMPQSGGESTWLWVPPLLLASVAVPVLAGTCVPGLRRKLAWRLPAFREASLCRGAAAIAVLLRAGATLPEALALLESAQRGTPAAGDFALWQKRCAEGESKFAAIAAGSRVFPPMFVWLVAGAGEDIAGGFERAAKVYQGRATYLANVLLYAALPAALIFLGLMILSQIYPLSRLIFDLPRLFLR